jgi:ACS family glucarate transporter-like MFS transporter
MADPNPTSVPVVPAASRRALVLLLSAFSLVGYVLRMNISVAAPFMMTTLQLDKIQMGQVFSAFMLGYALFQVPWGVSGDRIGPGRTLTWAAIVWTATTLLTGLIPGTLVPVGTASLVTLMVLRFTLGLGEAAAYPLASRAIASWMPPGRRAVSFSALIVGMAIGSAFTPPLVSWAMVTLGWRASFYLCAVLSLGLALSWHRSAGSRLDMTGGLGTAAPASGAFWSSLAVLKDRNIAWMSLSYFFDSYVLFVFVFWLFLYLVEQRGMSVMSSGLYAALPFVTGMIFAPLAGLLSDALVVRWGHGWGRRTVAMVSLALSALFLVLGINVSSATVAIVGLSLSVGFLLCTEPAYWSTSMDLGGAHAGTAGGIMNMAGNLGGVVSTALVPVLIKYFGWPFAFRSAAALAAIAALIWLVVTFEPTGRGRPRADLR